MLSLLVHEISRPYKVNVSTELWWNDADGWEIGVTVDGHVSRATSSTKNLRRTGLGSNPGLRPP